MHAQSQEARACGALELSQAISADARMARDRSDKAQTTHRVRSYRQRAGLTLEALGDKIGMTGQNLGKIERGLVPLGEEYHAPLAEIFGIEIPDLFREPPELRRSLESGAVRRASSLEPMGMRESPPVLQLSPLRQLGRRIPVLGDVEAGAWREARQVEFDFAADFDPRELEDRGIETIPMDVPGYERATLFGLRVRGPSMNREYPDGRVVIVAPAAEAGVRDGDHVIVQRNRSGLVETTIKELVVDKDGRAQLWPRSDHPDHQKAIPLNPRETGQDRPRIIGVVVGDYRRRTRPDAPAIFDNGGEDHAE